MRAPTGSNNASRAKAGKPQEPAASAKPAKGTALESPPLDPGDTPDRFMARVAAGGVAGNARSLVVFGHGTFGELSLTDCVAALKDTARALNDGDLSAAVTMLSSQAVALNAMFGELARRSALNMGEYIDTSERYMRLALKAQGQCRATLETLAAIKNPPVLFARQANINNGGQQQVNNALGATTAMSSETSTRTGARERESQSAPSKLLEASDVERLDSGAKGAAGATHQEMATLGALNRAKNC